MLRKYLFFSLASISLVLFMNTVQAFSCTDTATTGIPQIECKALVALYDSTNGDNWKGNTNWKTTKLVSSWSGITVKNGSVSGINLSRNQLSGTIPPELANLSNLVSLYLVNNQLSGAIPPKLGNLSNLETLNLSRNQLSGTIPSKLANLSNLTFLWLSYNQLSGTIPSELANLSSLNSSFSINNNYLSGDIPSNLINLFSNLPPASEFGGLRVENNCLNPTDINIRNILDEKNPNWDTTQTQCTASYTEITEPSQAHMIQIVALIN